MLDKINPVWRFLRVITASVALMVIEPQKRTQEVICHSFVQHHIKVQACRAQSNPAWPNRGCSPCFECLPYSCCWCTPPAETCSSCERSQRNLKNTRAETYSQCIISLCRSRFIQDHKVLAMMHVWNEKEQHLSSSWRRRHHKYKAVIQTRQRNRKLKDSTFSSCKQITMFVFRHVFVK